MLSGTPAVSAAERDKLNVIDAMEMAMRDAHFAGEAARLTLLAATAADQALSVAIIAHHVTATDR